jgi:AraC-like DNA-binding protein
LTELGIDLDKLPRILRLDDAPFLFRATERIEHIFSEIYEIQDAYRQTYLKIKVLELFYFIYHACEDTLFQLRSPNIQRKHVQKIKRIQEYITEHIDRHITVRQLSQQFSLSETSIKTGFKSLYGTSIGSYLRTYRMHVAAGRLSAGEMSVLEVALSVGYENPSKFAAVFRTETGKAPLEYQKQMFLGSEVVPFELPQNDALNVRNAARSDRIPVRME